MEVVKTPTMVIHANNRSYCWRHHFLKIGQNWLLIVPWQRDLYRLLPGDDLHDSHLRIVVQVLPRFDNDVQVGVTKSVNDCRRLVVVILVVVG